LTNGFAQIKLTSGEIRLIREDACATIGSSAKENHKLSNLGKAGVNRNKGRRPSVRGH
jgi:large subunit ribosomal protein L2